MGIADSERCAGDLRPRRATGLADWLVGLDGSCYVGVASTDGMAAYVPRPGLRVFMARSPLDYAAAVMSDLVVEGIYDEVEANRMRSLAAAFTEGPLVARAGPRGGDGVKEPGPDPFDLLIAMSLGQADAAAASLRPSAASTGEASRR